MGDPARRRATYEDLLTLPEHHVGQIIDGELFAHPRPTLEHSMAASVLGADLGGPFDRGRGGPGGWWLRDEPELHLHGDILVPDLAGWRRERLPTPPRGPSTTVPPDWICEVLSPSTASLDRIRKLRIYAREGVAHAWLVDPLARTLEVFRLDAGQWVLVGAHDEDRVRAEPFQAIELELSALWMPPEV